MGRGAAAIFEPARAERTAFSSALFVIPVPLTEIGWGLSVLLSAIKAVALRGPVWVGAKLMSIVQDAPEATLEPQVLVWEKTLGSVPEKVMPVKFRAVVPVLVRVTTFAGPV